jgi:hypothetical protein
MSQTITLQVSGLYTSLNDYQGLPPGALDEANNVESRYKNVLEPRRGFEGLADSVIPAAYFLRLTNFHVVGTDRIIGLTSDDELVYYTGAAWSAIPGDVVTNIQPPDAILAKCRFITAGQNLYVTAQDGVRSLSSGSAAEMLRAGVPKGLNLEAETNDDQSGFFNNNVVLSTTGTLAASSALVTALDDTTGIAVGQYVAGIDVDATLIVQDLTYTSVLFGAAGNAITITYTDGAALVVSVVGTAISVQLNTGVSTATLVRAAVNASGAATALVSVAVTGTGSDVQVAAASAPLAGGLDNVIPAGTTVLSIQLEAPIIIQTGTTTAGSTTVTALASDAGIVAGVLVSGVGIPEGAKVVSISGGGPYDVVLDVAAYRDGTLVELSFTASEVVTLSASALANLSNTPLSFYAGAQVGYRMLFGRVETDINGNTITRLGSPSTQAISTNTSPYETNNTVTGTMPKNSDERITFVQLYRSPQTESISITPLDQYNLVYERALVAGDFTARVITITDEVPDSLVGIPLYTGSDQEGALQANDPPPMCWDMCKFRDFALYFNITRPTTLEFTIVSVGSPNGIQNGDTITIAGTFLGVGFSEVYTAASSENQATRQFKVFSGGTPSQNITDTGNSLIRVINYDDDLPVHALLLSSATDLPGQILLEADNPSYDTFTADASAHTSAYDPVLDMVVSEVNTINNGVAVSKAGELEAVPATNLYFAGDSSSNCIRGIPLRNYVVTLKGDGIYKVIGTSPGGLTVDPFDLTTKIIGADTAVSLNSGVWMLSNQGVVTIDDGGVNAKSIPIDDLLNRLIGSYLDNLIDQSFAVGYESDRKYILSVPDSNDSFTELQFNFNYVTECWTTWDRLLYAGFIHSNEGKLYIARANTNDEGVSKERKANTYKDFVDEAVENEIISVDGDEITLDTVSDVEVGDILFQDDTHFSPIVEVDLLTNVVTVQYELSFVAGVVDILKAYECSVTWKQVFGDNPAFVRQYSEGIALFKNTRFNEATVSFVTDFSQNESGVTLTGVGNALWGLFPWGEVPWGGTVFPSSIRFLIPQEKQLGSYLLPSLMIRQGYSDFRFQGLAIAYTNVSQEVGVT